MKKLVFLIFLMFLTFSIVNAESTSSGYSLLIRKGETSESFSTGEVTSETKNIWNNAVSFSNSFIKIANLNADRLAITDASATLSGPLNMTIIGDNTIGILNLTSCSISISGSGTLKFVPSFFGEEGIVTNVEEQKQFVGSRIKTSLPITYEDGYVYINKPIVNTNVNEIIDDNKVDVSVSEEPSKNSDNKVEFDSSTNNNSSINNSGTSDIIVNDGENDKIVDDQNNVIDNGVNNNVVENVESLEKDEVLEREEVNSDNIGDESPTKNEMTSDEKTENILLYVGTCVGTVAVAGVGFFVFKKFKLKP